MRNVVGMAKFAGVAEERGATVAAFALSLLSSAFGKGNIGFIWLATLAVGLEYTVCMISAALRPDASFSLAQQWRFVLKRALLMLVPICGAIVDWTYWYMTPRTMPLGQGSDPHMYFTKALLIPIVAYLVLQSVKQIAFFYKDFPAIEWLMNMLDRMQRGGQDPPQKRRKYDHPDIKESTSERRANAENR